MVNKRKEVLVIVFSIGLIISAAVNIKLITDLGVFKGNSTLHSHEKEILRVGIPSGFYDLDPIDSWDSDSWRVINQVCEGLLFYNYSDPSLPLTNLLATDYTFANSTTLHITLRRGVRFHDGTQFNADAVIWNFKRLQHFMNHTGTLPGGVNLAIIHSLFEFADGTPIISNVVKTGEFSIQINLNGPYSSVLNLLAFPATRMISPTYHEALNHLDYYINRFDDKIVGTGPYKYVEYVVDKRVSFIKNENYWMEPVMFDELILDVIEDPTDRNYAMLAGTVDFLIRSSSDFWDIFKKSPFITFKETDKPGLAYNYLGMNNKQINVTWRKAISYAINYTYILQDMWQNGFIKSYGPVSPGFTSYFDDSLKLKAPYYNLTIARQTLIDDLRINTTDLIATNDPNDLAWENANLTVFNYTYYSHDSFLSYLYDVLKEWLRDIGIILEDASPDWWLFRTGGDYNKVHLFWSGLGPDYLDPMTIILPLFSNDSLLNFAQVNDPTLNVMIADYLSEPLEPIRKIIIKNISEYLATELYPHAFGFHPCIRFCHAADLYNVPYNVAGAFWAYPIKRNYTWAP